MLTLTPLAHDTLTDLRRMPHVPAGSGLRIRRHEGRDGFSVGRARTPGEDEVVVEDDGVRVFLGPVAARRFDRHELDVRRDRTGRLEFVVRGR